MGYYDDYQKNRYGGSWIYFVTTAIPESPIKIGSTNKLVQRLKALQGSSPFPLVVKALIRHIDMYGRNPVHVAEKELHEHYKAFRLHGEWFTPAVEIERFIAGYAKSVDLPLTKFLAEVNRDTSKPIDNEATNR